ncbi:MAG: hypothetical protein NTX53_07305 [candidate division WOR-3 bacterium]|nr:hypothetical protein [candidate division WOR-3 bacterium]
MIRLLARSAMALRFRAWSSWLYAAPVSRPRATHKWKDTFERLFLNEQAEWPLNAPLLAAKAVRPDMDEPDWGHRS